ncbi:MAG: serine/threonine-protein kinase [Limisphaerales bacterium]
MSQEFFNSPTSSPGIGEHRPPEIPDHHLLRRIARGGYGEVWIARNLMGTYRAVKVVYRDSFQDERPFRREYEGIRQFEPISREHPGLVDVLQVGSNEPTQHFYCVMELADNLHEIKHGEQSANEDSTPTEALRRVAPAIDPQHYVPKTLRNLLRIADGTDPALEQRRCLPVDQCLRLGAELTSTLEYLHSHQLVHRDIKPSNIIFVNGSPKLADIGLVTAAREDCTFVGTEGFVAPEGPGRAQADIYALGKVLYEMTTGFSAREFPKLPDGWKDSPEREQLNELNQVILRACEGNPRLRYVSATEMRVDLELLLHGKSLALRQLSRTVQRLRWTLAGAAILFLLTFFIAGFWYFRNRTVEQDRQRILRELQISQMHPNQIGWFSNNWSRLEAAAEIRKDQALVEQVQSLLAGWDGELVHVETNTSASSAAFAPDGRVVVAGAEGDPALIMDTNGVVTRLASKDEGPVCWTRQNTPIQLTVISNRLVLRDMITGNVHQEFRLAEYAKGFTNSQPILAISQNGDEVAAVVQACVSVWNGNTGSLIGRLPVNPTAMTFAPDGSLLGCGDGEGMIHIYSLPSCAEIAVLPRASRGSPITSLAFTRDRLVPYGSKSNVNSWLLAAGHQGSDIVIWDLRRKLPRTFCRGSQWTTCAVAFSPDGLTLATSTRSCAQLWDVASGRPFLLLPALTVGDTTVLAFDATGKWFICGGLRGYGTAAIGLIELSSDHGIHCLAGLASPVRKVWFSPNSELIAALTDDGHVGIWRITNQALLNVIEVPINDTADSAGGCFDPTSTRFVFSAGHQAILYDAKSGNTLQKWNLQPGFFDQPQWDDHGNLLLVRREDIEQSKKRIWRLYALEGAQTLRLLHQQTDTAWMLRNLAFPFGAKYFVAWSFTGELYVYDKASGRELWHEATGIGPQIGVFLDPTGETFGYNFTQLHPYVRIRRFSDFKEVKTTASGCSGLAPSGSEFSTWGPRPDNLDWKEALPFNSGTCLQAVFSPNGKLLAAGNENGTVYFVETEQLGNSLSAFMPK